MSDPWTHDDDDDKPWPPNWVVGLVVAALGPVYWVLWWLNGSVGQWFVPSSWWGG